MPDFRELVDLASERVGGSVLYANDDFFAEKENLLRASKPVWREHEYTDRGKWMDGWESRRRRVPGHDFAILRLGIRGVIEGVVVDTSFFRGNFPESCSLEAADLPPQASVQELLDAQWRPLLPQSKLQGHSENVFPIESPFAATHLRFNIFPDGGVARLRVHGRPSPDWHRAGGVGSEIDLAAVENGGDVLDCSDMFFGPKHNLIMPGRAANMSDGWETRRRRGPGQDWVIVRLATEGIVRRIEIDTSHFKGNYPDTASIEGSRDGAEWIELLPRTKLQAHTRHLFVDELVSHGPISQVRLNVFPDGGVSRLRAWGTASTEGRRAAATRYVNTLAEAQAALLACCASRQWAEAFAKARPFADWNEMAAASDRIWRSLDPQQCLEAFAAHPRIGEKREGARWSSAEQSGTDAAPDAIMRELADGNRAYEEKFGRVFLICATGLGAAEMLASLRERMKNDPGSELQVAAEEQQRITLLRLEKLVM